MKVKVFLVAVFLLLFNSFSLFAQGLPCDPDDLTCGPIDTWVSVLVAVALIFATAQLYRKQKLAGK